MTQLAGIQAPQRGPSISDPGAWRLTQAGGSRGTWLAGLALLIGLVAALGAMVGIRAGARRAEATAPRPAGPATPWSAVPLSARGAVSAAIGADQASYRLRTSTGGHFQARNPAQDLRASFGRSGIVVSSGGSDIGLRLVGIASDGSARSLAEVAPRAEANRVVYAHAGVSEWYANGPLGVEQGFTVSQPRTGPAHGHALVLSMALSGDLRASRHGASVRFDRAGRPVLAYRDLVVSDARGHRLAASLVLRAGRLDIVVDTAGAAYPIRVDPFVQQAELTASDGVKGSYFGRAVALSSDGSTLVVGSPVATVDGSASQGAAYVFTKPAGGWADATQTAELTVANLAADSDLGESVAVAGDGKTVFVGANDATVGANSAQGAVYVFSEPSGGWASETSSVELTAQGGTNQSGFGGSLAVSSAGTTLAVGAYNATVAGNAYQGAVYLFFEPSGGWASGSSSLQLTASDTSNEPFFSTSLAISGDGSTVIAGAPLQMVDSTAQAGEAYVFSEPTGGWVSTTQSARLSAPSLAESTQFAESVAVSDDGSTVAVGYPGQTVNANSYQGAVDVFAEPAGGWAAYSPSVAPAELTVTGGASEDDFGDSVALSGDGSTLVGGAAEATVGANTVQGALYVFGEPAGGWVSENQNAELTASNGTKNSGLGAETVISNDGSTILAGDPNATVNSTTDQGAAYVFGASSSGGSGGSGSGGSGGGGGTGSGTTTGSTTTTSASTTTASGSTPTSTAAPPPLTPVSSGSGTPSASAAKLTVGRVRVSGTSAKVPLTCSGPSGVSCAVKLSLSVTETVRGAKVIAVSALAKKKKLVTLTSAKLTVGAAHSRTLALALDAAGRRLLTQRHRLTAKLLIIQTEGRKNVTVATKTVTFTAKAQKKTR